MTALLCKSSLNYSNSGDWADKQLLELTPLAGGRVGRPALAQLGSWVRPWVSDPNLQTEAHSCAAARGPENRNKTAQLREQSTQ